MKVYIVKRLLALIPVLLIVATVVFLIIHLTPGDPAAIMLGPEATLEDIEILRERLGLNQPFLIQLLNWYKRVAVGDLGRSIYYGTSVNKSIIQHVGPTILLTLLSLSLAIGIAIPFGVIAASRHNTGVDKLLVFIASIGLAMPNFWLGLLLIIFFAVTLLWLPVSGYVPPSEGVWTAIKFMILPSVTLGTAVVARLARMTRATMLEVLKSDYIRAAAAKGLKGNRILFKHALKNAMIPTLTAIGLSLANLMGGAVITERIFNIPGVGRMLVDSVFRRDYPMIQGIVLYVALTYVLVNLFIDILYVWLDPRIEYK